MSFWSVIFAGVRHNWRTTLSVALGVAIATSVIVGALLVGDSMRGSLRELTVERLGKIDSVIAPGGFFATESIAKRVGQTPETIAAVLLFDQAVIEANSDDKLRRSGSIQVVGCDDAFWNLDTSGVAPKATLDDSSVVITESLATELGVNVGDQVTVRLPVEQAVPADSPLGRKDVQTEGIPRLKVAEILPDKGLARFSLTASQAAPKNVFLSRELIASVLDRDGQANVLLSSAEIVADRVQPTLEDLGLKLQHVTETFDGETVFDYYNVTSDRLLISDAAVDAITDALPADQVTPVLTYLANEIRKADAGPDAIGVTYSTITAADSSRQLPLDYGDSFDLSDVAGVEMPIVVNSWLADRLQLKAGDRLAIDYYEPETQGGKEVERQFFAKVAGIVPLTEPKQPYRRRRDAVYETRPTRYNDPDLTPTVPGVTDQDSMSDWDTPFELTREVPDEDDQYWKNHRLTPKAFLPLQAGRQLFSSRFGHTTGLLIDPSVAASETELRDQLLKATATVLPALGWQPRAIRGMQLAASKGTTPFDGLFLSLSMFVIFSAVMLIAMLFRLGLVTRSGELGTLIAVGLRPKQVNRLYVGEGLLVSIIGVVIGIAGGVGYAFGVLAALRSFWVGAVTVPFLTFHASALSLFVGAIGGLVCGVGALWMTTRSMLKNDAVTLLKGQGELDEIDPQSHLRWPNLVSIGLVVVALAAGGFGAVSGGQAAAGGFVGGGMMLLIAILVFVYGRFRGGIKQSVTTHGYNLGVLARRNSIRAPLRSTLTIGLIATASFLIVAINAFRLSPSDEGTGGFDLLAETAQPLYQDLSDASVQSGLLGPDAKLLRDATVIPFRVRRGQDASCNNLYRASEPTVYGVPVKSTVSLDRFRFYASAASGDESPWEQIDVIAAGTEEDPVPLILDQNTAMWSLQMMGGVGEVKSFTYDTKTIYFKVVGLLENSLLQGRLMVSEANFETLFPSISGYRFFLIDAQGKDSSGDQAALLTQALESRLGDVGFDVSNSADVLAGMMAVQNTYLRTFQSLGGLGLLLGTVGLAVAQVRNLLQRRRELAVMRAIGFTRRRLATMVVGETASLLAMGIGCGVLCAVLAVLPYAWSQGITPPVLEPILIVAGIFVFGLFAGLVAAIQVARMRLLDSLRGS
ncbi:FtsX-like permease family protein [Rhodopirellula sp. MGV]|uniref:FtsX-like permease family protein n=1 Tax=Rhodopirellula sp. MGV TaxID=2023130 RepID=UPI001E52246E|nr:FtsX-like permease family protein [Rhodopirellula sp. MGV]